MPSGSGADGVPVDGGSEVGGLGDETVGRSVGKLGSPPGPQPGQMARPSTLDVQPAMVTAAAIVSIAATPAFTPLSVPIRFDPMPDGVRGVERTS